MPRFEPFHALRYASADLNLVAAPPYDVLSEADREALAQRHPNNIVHIDVPVESDGSGRYDAAGDVLDNWVTQGVLVEDAEPSFTIYRMTCRDEAGTERTTFGVIGALEVVDEGAGGVLPHERTTPKAKTANIKFARGPATTTQLRAQRAFE